MAFALLHTIYLNGEAFRLNSLFAATLGAGHASASAWTRRLSNWTFGSPELVHEEVPLSSQLHATRSVATGFGFSGSHPNPPYLTSHPTLLVPLYPTCQLCGGALKQDREVQDVWIVTEEGFIEGQMAGGRCKICKTAHFPDRYTSRLLITGVGPTLCAVYNPQATHLRIGRNLWADRSLAVTMTGLRYSGHMSSEALSQNFNDRHPNSSISLSPKQVWKHFVLHESISKCAKNNVELVVPAYSQVHDIAGLVNDMFHSGLVKVIPGALSHRCAECHHPHRTNLPAELRGGAAITPEAAEQLDLVSLLLVPCDGR